MVYTIDYYDDYVELWTRTAESVECHQEEAYTPTLYVLPDHAEAMGLSALAGWLNASPAVIETRVESWRRGWRYEHEEFLRIDVDANDRL